MDVIKNLTTDQIYKEWEPHGILTGLDKAGIFNNTPLYEFLHKYIDEGYYPKRDFDMACVDAISGNYVIFDQNTEHPIKAVVSSSSIPFVFPPQIWDYGVVEKVVCMDGGSTWNANLVSAAQRCRELVEKDEDITIDIMLTDPY